MDRVSEAFDKINRRQFVPKHYRTLAGLDEPLSIGYGQTISQPTTVKRMLKWLNVKPGHKVLDVGSGSGWTTALLANLCGPEGFVYAVEIVPELVELGERNCEKMGVVNVSFHRAGPVIGLPSEAPFDRILVSAAAETLPTQLPAQLSSGGKLVVPVGSSILEITKLDPREYIAKSHHGYAFVPLH